MSATAGINVTSIAYDQAEGVLAADTKIVGEGTSYTGPKLRRLPDGGMIGVAGTIRQATGLMDWMEAGRKGKRPPISEVDAIWVRGDGKVFNINGSWPPVSMTGHVTCGTGAQAAMAVLKLGLGAVKAIEIACLVDPESGGPVETMSLEKQT
jgi:hypothetical protein